MQGTVRINFHGYDKNRNLLVKLCWIQQTNNQGTTCRYCLGVVNLAFRTTKYLGNVTSTLDASQNGDEISHLHSSSHE